MFKGVFKSVTKNERGVGLIEVLVALAILGVIAVAFLTGLATTAKAVVIADVRTTAESLARTQMEDIKGQPYDDTSIPPVYDVLSSTPPDFSIDIAAERMDPEEDGTGNDDGIQKITVTVEFQGEVKITLEDYKVNR